jgi:hypothetical protein
MSDALAVDNGDRLEQIAVEIETIQGVALLKVGERLLEAQQFFRHDRDEGGFTGWIETRLSFSRRTAYKLIDVFKAFGAESVHIVHELPKQVLYALAEPGTPPYLRDQAVRIAAGPDAPSKDDIADLKEKLRAAKAKAAEHKQQFEIERGSSEDVRVALRSSTNEALFLKQTIGNLQAEIERLKEPGVIHSYVAENRSEPATVTPIRTAEPNRSDCLSTAMDLISDRFDGDVAEIVALIREAGQFTVASELEAAAQRRSEAA